MYLVFFLYTKFKRRQQYIFTVQHFDQALTQNTIATESYHENGLSERGQGLQEYLYSLIQFVFLNSLSHIFTLKPLEVKTIKFII